MSILKLLSLIFLAVFLIFNSIGSLFGFNMGPSLSFLLGLCAVASGVLMLLSIHEYQHFSDDK